MVTIQILFDLWNLELISLRIQLWGNEAGRRLDLGANNLTTSGRIHLKRPRVKRQIDVKRDVRGVSGGPYDVSLSDSYRPDRCSFSSLKHCNESMSDSLVWKFSNIDSFSYYNEHLLIRSQLKLRMSCYVFIYQYRGLYNPVKKRGLGGN